jgi:hypothetical protein
MLHIRTSESGPHCPGRRHHRLVPLAIAFVAMLWSSCGGGSNSMSNNTLSAAQAQAISQQVVASITTALGNSLGVGLPSDEPRPTLGKVIGEAHPDASSGCTSTATGESCSFPLSYSGSCSGGGTISVSGDVSGSLNNSGSGSVDAQIAVTPDNCSVSNVTFNGDPDITIGGQIAFANSGPSFPITFSEGGGISYGPNPSGSCQVNVIYSINSLSSCTVTGSVCGQSVNGSC